MITIKTRVGLAIDGDNIFRGHAVNTELAGDDGGLTSLFSLAIGGRKLSPEDAMVVEDVGVCSAAAVDPRIWPLKLTRLVASYGGVLPGVASGRMALEGAIVGTEPTGRAAETLVEWGKELGEDPSDTSIEAFLDELLTKGRASGFGVAFRKRDERVDGVKKCIALRKRENGRYWKLTMKLDALMQTKRKVQLNLAMASAAALLDVGFTPQQIRCWMGAYTDVCFFANAVEAAEQRDASLQRLPDETIDYIGRGARLSPRAQAKRTLDSQAPVLAEPSYR